MLLLIGIDGMRNPDHTAEASGFIMEHAFRNISLRDYFRSRRAVLGTMHGKEQVIAPVLQRIGLEVELSERIDTDSFGTFAGEIARPASQLQTLRLKVEKCLELHPECDIAIASEGAFHAHPASPFLTMNTEMVMLKDKSGGLEVIGHHISTDPVVRSCEVRQLVDLELFLEKMNFPEYGVILKIKRQGEWVVAKDFQTRDEVDRAFQMLHAEAGQVNVGTDLRAHRNPKRMSRIEEATKDLADRLEIRCPQCGFPGFVVTSAEQGLPCQDCASPTRGVLREIRTCACCRFSEEKLHPQGKDFAPASTCDFCNP